MIATPGGKIASNQICKDVPIQMGSNLIKTDLILLNLEGMDILLGTDWMTRHQVSLDISSRAVEIDSPDYKATILYLPQREYIDSCVYTIEGINLRTSLSYMSTQMFFRMICRGYLLIEILSLL
jgi:hypothetical protein